MGKNQSASNLPNIIQYSNGSINFVSGSTLLMQISSSGAITTTGVISGSNALSSSYAVNADQLDGFDSTSFVFTSSYNSDSSSVSTRVTKIEGNYATTGSNIFTGAQTVCANITSTGTIIAQTLNVQQVTSSIVYSSGSNIFGNQLTDVQQMTGSLRITGSFTVTGSNAIFSVCCVGINTSTPAHPLQVNGAIALGNLAEEFTSNLSYAYPIIYAGNKSGLGNGDLVIQPRTTATRGIYFATRTGGAVSATNPAIRMAITYDGLVGIGTASPEVALHVTGSSFNTGYFFSSNQFSQVWVGTCLTTNKSIGIGYDSTNEYGYINIYGTTAGSSLTFKGTNIGIGTSSPCANLHVCTVNTTAQVRVESACDQASLRLIAGVPGTARASRIDFLNGATCVGRPQWTIINDYNQIGTNALEITNCDPLTKVFSLFQSGISCFSNTLCAPSLSIPGCIINTTDGGIFLKHCVSDKNFWIWQENAAGWGQFTANNNTQINALGGLFAGSGLVTFMANGNAGCGISLSSLTGAGSVCGVIALDHSKGSAYFAGSMGIGTIAPNNRLEVQKTGAQASAIFINQCDANEATIRFKSTHNANSDYRVGASILYNSAFEIYAVNCSVNRFWISQCGAVMIGTGGDSAVNDADPVHKIGNVGCGTSYARLMMQERTGCWISFNNGNGVNYGVIQRDGGAGVTYGSNSDYRLKTNIQDMNSDCGLSRIMCLRPVLFDWISEGKHGEGFIAHELQEIIPNAVSGNKDAISSETGCPVYQNVDTRHIVPSLVKAIQEQQCTINQLRICLGLT